MCSLLWCVLGQAVGRSQRRKGIGIGLHQHLQLFAQGIGLCVQGLNVCFHGGIFLFAGGQVAHHIAQRYTGSTHQRRRSAAARRGGFAGQLCEKFLTAQLSHFHL